MICSRACSDFKKLTKRENDDAQWIIARSENVCDKPLVGAQGTEVVAIALNDYRTTIPLKDFDDFDVILALKRDKQYMPVSDKGPLFVVYPYDSAPELHAQKYYARSIWQLTRLIVR